MIIIDKNVLLAQLQVNSYLSELYTELTAQVSEVLKMEQIKSCGKCHSVQHRPQGEIIELATLRKGKKVTFCGILCRLLFTARSVSK